MKKEIIQAVTCFCVLLACGLVWARALADGDAIWALIFNWLGFVAMLKTGWHIAAAVKAAEDPRRSRRLSADGWWRVLKNVNRKGDEK